MFDLRLRARVHKYQLRLLPKRRPLGQSRRAAATANARERANCYSSLRSTSRAAAWARAQSCSYGAENYVGVLFSFGPSRRAATSSAPALR